VETTGDWTRSISGPAEAGTAARAALGRPLCRTVAEAGTDARKSLIETPAQSPHAAQYITAIRLRETPRLIVHVPHAALAARIAPVETGLQAFKN